MVSRISYFLSTLALAVGCAGCIHSGNQKQVVADKAERSPILATAGANPSAAQIPVITKPKADNGPKRKPLATTEVSYGQLKDGEADSEAGKKNPELRAKLRDEARQAYQQAIKTDPKCIEAYKHLGRLYVKMGDTERALDIYKTLLVKYPKDGSIHFDLGMCHHRRKDFDESIRCFKQALEIDPENRDFLRQYGLTLAWTGQVEPAFECLSRVQGPALAHCNIAGLLLGRGQRDQALHHVRQAERLSPDLPQVLDLLARLEQPARTTETRAAAK